MHWVHPLPDPFVFHLGGWGLRWYALMYLLAFAQFWMLARYRTRRPEYQLNKDQLSDLVFYGAMGVILGGRIGYVFFYSFSDLLADPFMLFRVWEGGMSFHGGFIGVLVSLWVFSKRLQWRYFKLMDFVAPLVPLGLGFGRIGNFINAELPGRVSDVSWAIIYPNVDQLPRHPSALYQAFGEGVVLFTIVWLFALKNRPVMAVSGVFTLTYGLVRFTTEFFRQPDPQLGYIAFDWLTMGQILSLPLVLVGLFLILRSYRRGDSL